MIEVASKLKQQIDFYICPYLQCVQGTTLGQSLAVLKDEGSAVTIYNALKSLTKESSPYLETWFKNNALAYVAALSPASSALLLSGDRVIVLGITRGTLPKLTALKRASKYGEKVDYAWVDVHYSDYLSRVYSIGTEEAIIVIRPKSDTFWTDKGKLSTEVWIDEIVKGNISGKSSIGMFMRGWKNIVSVGEKLYEWFSENPLYFMIIACFLVGGMGYQLFGTRKEVSEKAD